jgi:polysaccharide export outer membrane protein
MFSAGKSVKTVCVVLAGAALLVPAIATAQAPRNTSKPAAAAAPAVSAPADYVIGPTDVLSVVFWREDKLSGEVVVRPDGKVSLPLINDIQAAGLTPLQFRDKLAEAARRFLEDPVVSVSLRQVNNNRVFITGQVANPGAVSLAGPTTVLQLIAMAGGLNEFADRKRIVVTRVERGTTTSHTFNYEDVLKGKNLPQNIVLKPGDTIVVP